jgi:hypothetical protein
VVDILLRDLVDVWEGNSELLAIKLGDFDVFVVGLEGASGEEVCEVGLEL